MAFVYRSDRTNNSEKNKISIGPGEYNEELSKTQGRLLHQNHMKYSSVMKNNKKPLIVPFNTTSKRSKLFDGDNLPGPGSYTLTSNFNNTNTRSSFTHTSSLMDKDIQEIFSMYKTNPNKKGFLSSEKRFNKSSTAEKFSPGPGSYELRSYFLKNENDNKNANNKYITEKYALNKGKTYKLPGNSEEITSSIPDKSKGEFKIVKGLLTQVKKPPYDSGQVGPGKYNLFSNWNAPGLTWDKGYKKEDKKYNKSDIQKELEQNSSMLNNETYSEKMHNFNNNISSISTNFNAAQRSNNNLSSVLTMTNMNMSNNYNNSKYINANISGWNTTVNLNNNNNNSLKKLNKPDEKQMRNKIFHNFIKSREDLHSKTMSKLKPDNNLIMELEYPDFPGPGFYNQKIIPKHTSFMSTAHNFGSTSPKFKNFKTENEIIGPGAYFKEKNKYQPEFKTVLHAKNPERQKRENNDSVFVQNLIRNNREKMPGPGEYDLEGKLIKKEISNNKSFGSNVERFKWSKTPEDQNHGYKKEINDNNIKEFINQSITEEDKKDQERIRKRQYLKKVEKLKKKEKQKREKFLKIKMPSVGTYSPEITSSIQYQVLSKLNPYRNQVAPFNIVDSRFSQIKNPRLLKNIGTPGPADYNVLPAFNAINLDKRKYNIFGQNKQRETRIRNTFVPGPGIYNLDNPNIWNIKSFNVLFINNHK